VRAQDLPRLVATHAASARVLSLDCFDTILFRDTAAPVDVFYDLAHREPFQRLGFSAKLRVSAESMARSLRRVRSGTSEVTLDHVYRGAFPDLDDATVRALAEAELAEELRHCFAFPPTVELLRAAKEHGLRVVVVSDTYFREAELRRLLESTLPADAFAAIGRVFCSSEYGRSKSTGLFEDVIERLAVSPDAIVHVGDNERADALAPAQLGIRALHFVHHASPTQQVVRLTSTALSLLDPSVRHERALPSPFHAVLAQKPDRNDAGHLLGYVGVGPILYAFGRFLLDELAELERRGERPCAAFLMRDAYLPRRVCEALAGHPVGASVSISRFVAHAASFRARADVERYLARSAGSRRFEAMAKQLLLPEREAARLVAEVTAAERPLDRFIEHVLAPKAVERILAASAQYRKRVIRHLVETTKIERGQTLVLVDLGYEGTVQQRLTPVLEEELGVRVVSRYLIASRVPGWEGNRRGLLDPALCDDRAIAALVPYVALLEDLCTSDDASVVDYLEDGTPIRADHVISREQFERILPVQEEVLAFARDAESLFARTGKRPEMTALRRAALGAIGRILFMPTEAEMEYLQGFRLDMNLATIDSFALFDRERGLADLRRRGLFFMMEKSQHSQRMNTPIELRAAGLELSLSMLAHHRYALAFSVGDTSLRTESVPVVISRGTQSASDTLVARATHEGYFSLLVPVMPGGQHVAILFGQRYSWVQIDSVELIPTAKLYGDAESEATEDASAFVRIEGIDQKAPGVFECRDPLGFLFVAPPPSHEHRVLRVVFRPLAPASERG